ncbi:MAG: hypothetical protein PHP02_07970 [Eubacteriales bacterium]|nr:hypothetical protein [Eubacteriales bacterium]
MLRRDICLLIVRIEYLFFLVVLQTHIRYDAVHEAFLNILPALVPLVRYQVYDLPLQLLFGNFAHPAQLP